MATINLIYFGSVMDITGTTAETLTGLASIDELNQQLIARFPGLAAVSYRFSVNRKLTTENLLLTDGDEIALLPPFAGG
jgi:molybdopterin synthase sulfur carrier subunit